MLVGYVSDQWYLALPDTLLEIRNRDARVSTRSTATGAVYAELPAGRYQVTLARDGYGSKTVEVDLGSDLPPHQFRLLKDDLLGYAWPKWVRAGERSEFRVHSDSAYRLDLFRYGLQKEHVRTIGWFDEHGPRATIQITPDGDYTQTGVQWNKFGYSSPHHKQFVEAPQRSGLYHFHAKGESGRFFSFPWIVAPREPAADIAVLASNITWNAYNNFGGRSNYIHPDQLPPTPTGNARLELHRYTDPEHVNYRGGPYGQLSFERPEPINSATAEEQPGDPIEGRAACHLASAEWRLLAWMEREGFHYDYYAETQLHFDQLPLDRYKVLVLSTHPEYWSAKMYFAVKSWVFERGGKLVYLGGNGLNCDVEFLDEATCIYQNDDERRLRTEEGFESRFHLRVESEASLLGVVYSAAGIMTAAPFRVQQAGHWAFEGTGLEEGERFGQHCQHQRVPGGASGHETDKRSPSSPSQTQVLAQGLNPDEGGAHLAWHETSSGGQVFSAGSITWPSSLLVDSTVSRITANVLRRFRGP